MLIGGAVLAIGVVIFALTCLGASGRDRGVLIGTARVAGIVVAVGAVLDLLAHSEALGGGIADGLSDVLRGSLGTAEGLRVAGGLALALSWASSTATWELLARDDDGADGLRNIPPLAAFGVVATGGLVRVRRSHRQRGTSLRARRREHRARRCSRRLGRRHLRLRRRRHPGPPAVRSHRAGRCGSDRTSQVSTSAASLARRTNRPRRPPVTSNLGRSTRSQSGSASRPSPRSRSLPCAAAGIVMTWFILPSFDSLWESSWGRTLLVKVGATTIAALMGGFNHLVLLPRLRTDPDDETRARDDPHRRALRGRHAGDRGRRDRVPRQRQPRLRQRESANG
ncbi:MAG: CopD family protein [Ilumatobacteraceae bacterium]